MDAFVFGQVKRNDWSRASRWSSHTVGDVADASYPAWLYHSSEGSCVFMVLLMHTSTSAIAPVSRYRLFTSPKHTHTHTHSPAYTRSKSGCPNKPVKGPLMSPIEVLNRKSLCYIRVQCWQEAQLLLLQLTATAQTLTHRP